MAASENSRVADKARAKLSRACTKVRGQKGRKINFPGLLAISNAAVYN